MEYGSMRIHRLQSGRWLNWGIRFFLTAALTASQTAGGYAPFALGCIAAAGPGADGAAALLGGVRVETDDLILDGSLRAGLSDMKGVIDR